MSNLGTHNTETCKTANGQPCAICAWAGSVATEEILIYRGPAIVRREIDDWDLERELNEYSNRYGEQALADKIGQFMTGRGIY